MISEERVTIVRHLNQRAAHLTDYAKLRTESLRIAHHTAHGVPLLDFGIETEGGLDAGLLLARICLSALAHVELVSHCADFPFVPQIQIRTDHPVSACMASQYAGWKVQAEDFFAMGSGPMRAVALKETLFDDLETDENGRIAIGVLESSEMPPESAIAAIRSALPEETRLTLAVAPTASQAGTIQVVARSVETALHKLHELKFPLSTIVSATGIAPLPPVAKNDLQGIGRTNDAILYGATVNLWVRCEDELVQEIGPKVPSNYSASHGQTFLNLFKAANHDFYAMDTALFSPAVVVFHNMKSGKSFAFGERVPQLLKKSFGL